MNTFKYFITTLFLFQLQSTLFAQQLQVNVRTLANNWVQVYVIPTADFSTSAQMNGWSTSTISLRILNTAPNDGPITASFPSANPTITGFTSQNTGNSSLNSIPWAGFANFVSFNANVTTFTQQQVGSTPDNYIWMQFVDNVANSFVGVTAGQEYALFEFKLPDAWDCASCLELYSGSAIPGGPSEVLRIGNAAFGSSNRAIAGTMQNADLPIELTAFEPRTDRCDAYLYWETATEKNFGYYQIEASKDGREFKALAQQKPLSPNSLEKRAYKYLISSFYQGYYFRLKAVDLDGSFEYSPVVATERLCDKQYSMLLYPNPNYLEKLTVEISSAEAQKQVQLLILDPLGKAIQLQKVDLEAGSNKVILDTENLPSGTYYVRLIGVPQLNTPLQFIKSNF